MPKPPRKLAFVTAATDHGTFIVNRFDQMIVDGNQGYGVGLQLLESAHYDPDEVNLLLRALDLRRQCYGDGVVAIDCGANVGVHTIEWAKHMTAWGAVLAIEAQERIYYALAGNIAINNCFNARAIHAAVSERAGTEFIGQAIDYSESKMVEVPTVSLDSLNLARIDLIKIDIEGMEMDALAGAVHCIGNLHPILLIETIKSDKSAIAAWLDKLGYTVLDIGINFFAIHADDKCLPHIKMANPAAA
ncbi:MAG TPA: FkbM family methyltransferase [Xanthobacteraceae bacterium]|nr:FkbM family methyltransferase [Xanthobacteraceae bacterium]